MAREASKQIKNIEQTLKTAMGQKDKLPLRRHHDDDYWDEITIDTKVVHLRAHVVPRYKTSGLSGDEWRTSAVLEVKRDGYDEPHVRRSFGRMHRDLAAYGPHFIYQNAFPLLGEPDAVFIVKRKGILLTTRKFPTFGDAAMGMGWHIVTANEGEEGVEWHHLTDEEERAHCQQVGCSDTPVNVYRLKKLMEGQDRRCFLEPQYDFVGQYVWYCARHTTRGDCGFEDADTNLELVQGDGKGRPRARDESPSAFGGVINVTLPKEPTDG